jgi:hypothetical protein
MADEYLSDAVFYGTQNDPNQVTEMVVTASSGRIGAATDIKERLQNYLYVSPHTSTRCISDSIAILDYVKNDRHAVNIFSWVKT